MYQLILFIFILIAVGLIALITLQQSRGADIGSSLNASASVSLFSSSGSNHFISRVTAVLAMLFFTLSLILGNLNNNHSQKGTGWDDLNQTQLEDKKTADKILAKTDNDIPQ